eukprot:c10722_g1_i1.p1 GENE.c10722_g1_i1~~c10722_g1_i1.p1  ORF type:complete len:466 (+),score=62.44 c10722_g1_i1:52-1449(+)
MARPLDITWARATELVLGSLDDTSPYVRVFEEEEPTAAILNSELDEFIAESEASLKNDESLVLHDAFFVMNLATVVRKAIEWRQLLPRVQPFYAVKCHPNPVIVSTLATIGVSFDCASEAEIRLSLSALRRVPGLSDEQKQSIADRIVFAHPCKSKHHLEFARREGVQHMTFDNAAELTKIHTHYPTARCILRLLPASTGMTLMPFGSKFGASEREAHALLKHAKALGINVVGVSFHVGSGCFNPEAYVRALELCRRVFDFANTKLGIQMSLLDIGGGWPGSDSSDCISFADMATVVAKTLDELFPEDPVNPVQIIAEPGRYFVTESATLAVSVVAKRDNQDLITRAKTDEEEDDDLPPQSTEPGDILCYLSDGVYGSFNNIIFDHAKVSPQVLRSESAQQSREVAKYTLFGPTCDSVDVICKGVELPKLGLGDWLYFSNMGAYTSASASEFNGFKLAAKRYVYS